MENIGFIIAIILSLITFAIIAGILLALDFSKRPRPFNKPKPVREVCPACNRTMTPIEAGCEDTLELTDCKGNTVTAKHKLNVPSGWVYRMCPYCEYVISKTTEDELIERYKKEGGLQ